MTARVRIWTALVIALMGLGGLATALAADARLDNAVAHLIKARALVAAAAPGGNRAEYARHVRRAEDLIDEAVQEINLAKAAAVAPPTPGLNPRKPPMVTPNPTMNPGAINQLNPQPEPPAPQ